MNIANTAKQQNNTKIIHEKRFVGYPRYRKLRGYATNEGKEGEEGEEEGEEGEEGGEGWRGI